ncbi:MAG: DNA polymerase/3'-5' exonuclease PolX [Clostridiales bacterium]|nr:DNA polymerase/3'-5' exonuclease PolX [Clostridiales bacterium]
MDKQKVADVLNELSILLELKGENPFKIRAYQNGARIIERLDGDLKKMVEDGSIGKLKGIGKGLAEVIEELVKTGSLLYFNELKEEFPETLFELLDVPGLGPKRVKTLYNNLGITSIGELEYACMENRLIDLPGFGKKMQENILKGVENLKSYREKSLYPESFATAMNILDRIKGHPDVLDADIAGSLRRHKEIIGDIDIVVAADKGEGIMDLFTELEDVLDIIGKGDTKSAVRLKNGMTADLRVVSPKEFPYAMNHFTGSKEHNTKMRHIAKKNGLKMNEYGVFNVETGELIPCESERDIYNIFNMDYIPPELREDMGEIEAAKKGNLPKLIATKDIKGVMHVHSVYSDGLNTIKELADHARELGYSYIGISDHSKSAYYANGLKEDDVKAQIEEIDRLNEEYTDFKILKGIESDILPDGSLDYDEDILSLFDFIIASVHSGFTMSRDDMTERILRAMDSPYVSILGHLTGRLLLSREGYDVDIEKIIEKAARENVAIEINANPYRLDLDWRWCKLAKDRGTKLVICPDAHDLENFDYIDLGVKIARKGWLSREDVLNCSDVWKLDRGGN